MKKVFVSGVFDLLHGGHAEFLRIAAQHGELYVSVGSDATVFGLKNRHPVYSETERLLIVRSIRYVKEAFIASGSGNLDFIEELKAVRPDIFIVNTDGHCPEKEKLCRELGIEYLVLVRSVARGMVARSSTEIREKSQIPFRLDLAGGWLDQPWVSKFAPGPVITVSIKPTHEFFPRSGMATSTRERAIQLWGNQVPLGDVQTLARLLFCWDNRPGELCVSGSQDSLGIVLPGVNRLYYNGAYWPEEIKSVQDENVLRWLERNIRLAPLFPRPENYSVIDHPNVEKSAVQRLAKVSEYCWEVLLKMNLPEFGRAINEVFDAQLALFPNMATREIHELLRPYRKAAHGIKIAGAGGGGYLILVTPEHIQGTIEIIINRDNSSSWNPTPL